MISLFVVVHFYEKFSDCQECAVRNRVVPNLTTIKKLVLMTSFFIYMLNINLHLLLQQHFLAFFELTIQYALLESIGLFSNLFELFFH